MAHKNNIELGCVYDTICFFSLRFHACDAIPSMFLKLEQQLTKADIIVEDYLRPLFSPHNNHCSWFRTLFQKERNNMTRLRLNLVLNNRQYLVDSLLTYFFPTASVPERTLLKNASAPQILDLIKREKIEPEMELYLLYILFHLQETLETFSKIVMAVFNEIYTLHNHYLAQENPFATALRNTNVMDKLCSIAGVQSDSALSCGLTLLEPDCMLHIISECPSFILGVNFKGQLDRQYKYCNVTPYSFATAIGNSVKYEIFKIFLKHNPTPISITDIALQYHASRNALNYNIKEMLHSGLIKLDHIQGQTYFYKLDIDFLEYVGEQLLLICK